MPNCKGKTKHNTNCKRNVSGKDTLCFQHKKSNLLQKGG
jgi:hypothetical protein